VKRFTLLSELFGTAISSIMRNKSRTFLTVLGIIIGVTTVIAMVGVTEGIKVNFQQQMDVLGSNMIYVSKFEPGIRFGRMPKKLRMRKNLTLEDMKALGELPSVESVVGQIKLMEQGIVRSKFATTTGVIVVGTTADYLHVVRVNLLNGRFFTESEEKSKANVAVLGADTAATLFPGVDPIGKKFHMGNTSYRVIGVMEKMGSFLGQSRDTYVILPISTVFKRYPSVKRRMWGGLTIMARPKSPELLGKAMDEITEVLRMRRRLRPQDDNDFAIFTQEYINNLFSQLVSGVFLVGILIASISLLVGGIGIMNIMLVSLRERTSEIGLRRAIGAKRKHIMFQFVVEAVTLSLVGGLLGMFFGFALSFLAKAAANFPAAVTPFGVLLGVGVSTLIGLFFGIYPAWKAANLNPVEALRYE